MTDIRPKEIGVWMRSRRTWINVPITDNDAFEQAWWSWWYALQPEARKLGTGSDAYQHMSAPAAEMDWKGLKKTGKNGLPLVMISLAWWGQALNEVLSGGRTLSGQASSEEGWRRAVVDVCASINCLGSICVDVGPSNPLASSSTANVNAGRPVRERKRVRPRDEGFEEPAKKKGKSRK